MVTPRINGILNWILNWIPRIASTLRALGPYAAIELLLPGGSLIALTLWVYRNRSELAARLRRPASQQPTQEATL